MKGRSFLYIIYSLGMFIFISHFQNIQAQEQYLLTSEDVPEGYELLFQSYDHKINISETEQLDGIWQQWVKQTDSLTYMIDVRYYIFDSELNALKGMQYYIKSYQDVTVPMDFGGISGHILGDLSWSVSHDSSYLDLNSYSILFLRGNVAVLYSDPWIDFNTANSLSILLADRVNNNLPQKVLQFEDSLKNSSLTENEYESITSSFIESNLAGYSIDNTTDSKWLIDSTNIAIGIRKEWTGSDNTFLSIDICKFDSAGYAHEAAQILAEFSTPYIFNGDSSYQRAPYQLDSLNDMPALLEEEDFTNDYSFVGYKDKFAVQVHFYNSAGINPDTVYSFVSALAGEIVDYIITSVPEENEVELSQSFILNQNYPNPFNPSTTINFYVPETSPVKLEVYDITGELVATMLNSEQSRGWHSTKWNGQNNMGAKVSSGIYFYRLKSGNYTKTMKMMILK